MGVGVATTGLERGGDRMQASEGPSLLATMRRFELGHEQGSEQVMRSCFHDEAVMETVASGARPLGPDATAAVLATAMRRDPFYVLGRWELEPIAEDVVLSVVPVRQRSETGGISHWTVYSL